MYRVSMPVSPNVLCTLVLRKSC